MYYSNDAELLKNVEENAKKLVKKIKEESFKSVTRIEEYYDYFTITKLLNEN